MPTTRSGRSSTPPNLFGRTSRRTHPDIRPISLPTTPQRGPIMANPPSAPAATATTTDYKNVYEHLVNVVMSFSLPCDLLLALKRLSMDYTLHPDIIISMCDSDYLKDADLEDPADSSKDKPLHKTYKKCLEILCHYIRYLASINKPLGTDINDWLNLTSNDYRDYRVSGYYPFVPNTATTPPQPVGAASIARVPDALSDFRRGIKRDISAFSKFQNHRDWDNYNRHLIAVSRAQGVYDVINLAYSPNTTQQPLFDEMQKFMYAVFESTLFTDTAKALVRKYESSFDARSIYRDLFDLMQDSTQATIDSSQLMSYVVSSRYDDGSWRGSTHSYILHWLEQIRKLHALIPASDHFSDAQQRIMLQTAVHSVADLRQVKIQADQDRILHKRNLTFDQYLSLLKSAATQHDAQFVPKRAPLRKLSRSRSVNEHEFDAHVDGEYGETENEFFEAYEYDSSYDIDIPIDVIEANQAKQQSSSFKPREKLLSGQWYDLDADAQKLWDKFTPQQKQVILRPPPRFDKRPSNSQQLGKFQSGRPGAARRANQHISFADELDDIEDDPGPNTQDDDKVLPETTLISAHQAQQKQSDLHPANLKRFLSSSKGKPPSRISSDQQTPAISDLVINGKSYRQVNSHYIPGSTDMQINGQTYRSVNNHIIYNVSQHKSSARESLVDRGANGGIAGNDVRIIEKSPHHFVNIRGIDNHEITEVPIVTAGGVIHTQHGPVIAIMHQYAYHGKNKTIHSSMQLEHYKNDVNDKSIKVPGGKQRILTLDGYVIPLNFRQGLPYLPLRPYTDDEWETLPHVVFTSDVDWDPTVFDHVIDIDNDIWYDALEDIDADPDSNPFDEFGDYRKREVCGAMFFDARYTHDIDDIIDACVSSAHPAISSDLEPDPCVTYSSFLHHVDRAPPDYEQLRKFFGYLPVDIVKNTFEHTTQHARVPISTLLKKRYKSPFPALNVHRRNEDIGTDTVFSDTPAIDDGSTMAQIFVGQDSLVTNVYGMKSEKQFVNTLEDVIRNRGAPNRLLSDRAQTQVGKRCLDILRALFIGQWTSEAHQQHQNPAERRWQTAKRMTNTLLDRSGSPAYTWLLCLMYVCFILNNVWNNTIQGVPIQRLTGSTNDISPILQFYWWQDVYYAVDDSAFPSESKEARGKWVGIAEHVGHDMTYKILTDDTRKIIFRSNVRAATKDAPNYRLDPLCGEEVAKPIIRTRRQKQLELEIAEGKAAPDARIDDDTVKLHFFNPQAIVGRSFLLDEQEDGSRFRATIVEAIDKMNDELNAQPERIRFRVSINDDQFEELMTYQQILDHIEKDESQEVYWRFTKIFAHQGPLCSDDDDYKGSLYNVGVERENGERRYEPLKVVAADDPVICAQYALDNGLLNVDGWKRFRKLAKRQKVMLRQVRQAKLRSYRTSIKYMFGFQVPRDYKEALALDAKFGQTRWRDCTKVEMDQLDEYDTFHDKGHHKKFTDWQILEGYKKIRCHLVYAIKHDGRHKARMVADGHLTDVPLDSVYSGVVSLRGLRLLIFLAELNELETWATDIGNAYLEAKTSEKVYIVAGPEFGDRESHILVIHKALYGLRTSGLRWHERLADCLRDMGFSPCWAEPDIWMRANDDVWEYIAVYVDDLAIAAKQPKEIVKLLVNKYNFKLKGTGSIEYHLGMDFFRDDDGVLCIAPRKYVKKMMESYERMFSTKPSQLYQSPLEKGDHPELDTTELLEEEDVTKYQSLIGAMQWAVSIGRIDITTAVMTMSSFRAQPRKGHLDRVKRIYGYLSKFDSAALRIRVSEPDFSDLPEPLCDWDYSVYGPGQEQIPHELPTPLGNAVTLSHYYDANLYHDMLTGKAVTGILHFANQTPIDWYSKKQSTPETATYGSEFIAGRTCMEQVLDLRHTLRYLGVPIRGKSYVFGDNQSVVNSSMHPHGKLHKRHVMLSFHRVRQCIAHGIASVFHVAGKENPADMVSKHWSHADIWGVLQPLMFWRGDTIGLV